MHEITISRILLVSLYHPRTWKKFLWLTLPSSELTINKLLSLSIFVKYQRALGHDAFLKFQKKSISFHDRLLIASTLPFRGHTSLATQEVKGKLTEWCQVNGYFCAQLELAISKTFPSFFPSVLCVLQTYSSYTQCPMRQLQRFLQR